MATGHFAPDRLQSGAPPLSNISFLFNKATFFYINKKLCRKWKIEQNKISKECLTLCQFFLLFILNFRIFSIPLIKSESIVVFLFSSRKKILYCKKKEQIQCCSWLPLVGEWRCISKSHMFLFVCLFVFFNNNIKIVRRTFGNGFIEPLKFMTIIWGVLTMISNYH